MGPRLRNRAMPGGFNRGEPISWLTDAHLGALRAPNGRPPARLCGSEGWAVRDSNPRPLALMQRRPSVAVRWHPQNRRSSRGVSCPVPTTAVRACLAHLLATSRRSSELPQPAPLILRRAPAAELGVGPGELEALAAHEAPPAQPNGRRRALAPHREPPARRVESGYWTLITSRLKRVKPSLMVPVVG